MGKTSLRFLHFELSAADYELRSEGEPVKLERLPMELLILLVENRGQLVMRQTIIERLWGTDVFLETEPSINTAVNKLRAVLHDPPKQPRCIQTVVGKGYRFIADVEELGSTPSSVSGDRGPVPLNASPHDGPLEQSSSTSQAVNCVIGCAADELSSQLPVADSRPASRSKSLPVFIALLCLVLLGTAVAFISLTHRHLRTSGLDPQLTPPFRSVAVLPFVDLSPKSDQEYIVDGMTDELITLLAQGTSVRVISRTSSMHFKGTKDTLPQIASALNVDAVVEGSVLRSGKSVRIMVQLLDAHRDRHLWAQSYQEEKTDTQADQDERDKMTADIVAQILRRLTNQPISSGTHIAQATNVRARDLYLRGGYFCHQRTLESLNKGIEDYRQAIQAAPEFADAYAALGEAYVLLASYGGPGPSGPLLDARAAAKKALELNDRLGQAHTVLGAVKVDLDWDWSGAEAEYRRALELDPNDSTAHHWLALHLARLGRNSEAETEMQRALELDPISVIVQTDDAEIAYEARNPVEARARLRRALELNPDFAEAHLVLGKIYLEEGRSREALTELQRSSDLFGAAPNIEAIRGHALALAGRTKAAEVVAANLEALSTRRYVSGVDIAIVYCALNNQKKADYWLERGFLNRDKGMDTLGTEPLFDRCRAGNRDHRFATLLRQLNLQ